MEGRFVISPLATGTYLMELKAVKARRGSPPGEGKRTLQRATVVMNDGNHSLHLIQVKIPIRRSTRSDGNQAEILEGQGKEAAEKVLVEAGKSPASYDYVGTLVAWTGDALNRGLIEWAKEVPPKHIETEW